MISADELAKMSDVEFLLYVFECAHRDECDLWRMLVEQNARRLQWAR